MAIEYDFYKTNGVLSKKSSYHVRVIEQQTVSTEEIASSIQQGTTLTIPDIKCTLSALNQEIVTNLSRGCRVHIEGLGYFSLAMAGEIYRDKNRMLKLKNPHVRTINFLPEERLQKQFKNLSYTCRNHKGQHSQALDFEGLEKVIDTLLAEKNFFTSTEFCHRAHVTRSTGYRYLKDLLLKKELTNIGTPKRILYSRIKTKQE